MKLRFTHGFSLFEVLVALGLFAMVVMAILDLWPLAQHLASEAEQNSTAMLIAERIAETLKATLPDGTIALAPDWISNPSHCLTIDLKEPSEHYLAYDAQGQPQGELTMVAYKNPLKEEKMAAIASIIITQDAFPGIAHIAIIVATPALFPERRRHHTEFALLLSTTSNAKEISKNERNY